MSPTGATETGIARRPGSHAQRGFRAVPQRVKTRETTPLTVSEDSEAGAARAPVEPDQHRRGHQPAKQLNSAMRARRTCKCPSPPACLEHIQRIKTHQLARSRGYVSSSEGAGALSAAPEASSGWTGLLAVWLRPCTSICTRVLVHVWRFINEQKFWFGLPRHG